LDLPKNELQFLERGNGQEKQAAPKPTAVPDVTAQEYAAVFGGKVVGVEDDDSIPF
jgi:hypothetical protein